MPHTSALKFTGHLTACLPMGRQALDSIGLITPQKRANLAHIKKGRNLAKVAHCKGALSRVGLIDVDVNDARNDLAQNVHDHRSCWSRRAPGPGIFGWAQRRVTCARLDAALAGVVATAVFDRSRRG